MSISARYRTLAADARILAQRVRTDNPDLPEQVERDLGKATDFLEELAEAVGEIPQFRLERELTPVLLKSHGALDRARLQLEKSADSLNAERVWELEQRLYRLLNDL